MHRMSVINYRSILCRIFKAMHGLYDYFITGFDKNQGWYRVIYTNKKELRAELLPI